MAETRISDCPKCGRTNVVGYRNDGKEVVDGIGAGYGAILGGLIGGPLGVAAGLWLGKKAGGLLADSGDGSVEYKFKCPNPSCCNEWVRYFPKVK